MDTLDYLLWHPQPASRHPSPPPDLLDPCTPCGAPFLRTPLDNTTPSADSAPGRSSTPSAEQLLDAVATGAPAADDLVAACQAAGQWPITPAAALYAAVKMRQTHLVEVLLQAGAPSDFAIAQLPAGDWAELQNAGVSADGCAHLSPLGIAVRQQSLEVARLLLNHGAIASRSPDGVPLLLHLHAAAATGGSSSQASRDSSEASGSGTATSTNAVCSSSRSTSDVRALLEALETLLQLQLLLMQGGSDPLQALTTCPNRNFLTDCHHPAMLRLAVGHVQKQCQQGTRQLSDVEAQQLVVAAGRAFLGGF